MKKVILVLVLVLIFGVDAVAQKDTVVVIGRIMDGTALSVPALHFKTSVFTFNFSANGNYLCICYRNLSKSGKYWNNCGEISYYNLNERRELWRNPINYQTTCAICTNKGILKLSGINSFYSNNGGIKLWKNTASLIQTEESHNLFFGYENPNSSKLSAYSLTDGSELWNIEVSHEYGWNDQINISTSDKLIVTDNLYRINFSTGAVFQYPLKVGMPDNKKVFPEVRSMLIKAGAYIDLWGRYYENTPMMTNENGITGMVSNICQNDSVYYIADCEKVSCVDTLLQPRWTCNIPNNLASHSHLFINGERLYMLNMGYGLKNGSYRVKCGKPFLASYDIHTGKQIYMNMLSPKKAMIEGAIATKGAFFMLFDNGLTYQNVVDTTINRHYWDVEKYGKLHLLITDTIYVIDSIRGNFTPVCFDGVNCPVYSDNGHVYIVDKNLNIKADYPRNLIYIQYARMKNYSCIVRNNDLWIVYKFGLPIAHLKISIRHAEICDNKLMLLTRNNDLLFIDMDKPINKFVQQHSTK